MEKCPKHQHKLEQRASSNRAVTATSTPEADISHPVKFDTEEERKSVARQLEESADRMEGVAERVTNFTKAEEEPERGSSTGSVAKATSVWRAAASGKAFHDVLPETSAGRASINQSFANFTHTAARRTLHPRFADLPEEHNPGSHDAILSRKRTPYTGGPFIRPKTPVTSMRSERYVARGGSVRLWKYIGHQLQLGKLSLRNCISKKRYWLQERFDKSKTKAKVEEEKIRVWRQMQIPIVVIERNSSDLDASIASGDLYLAEGKERFMAGDILGY